MSVNWPLTRALLVISVLLLVVALLVWPTVKNTQTAGRVYKIGWENDPPDEFLGKDGQPAGLTIDLVSQSARRCGIRLQWVRHDESSEAALRSGQVDLWPSMTITPERQKFLHISSPFIESILCLLVRSQSRFQQPADLAHATLGIIGLPINYRQLHVLLPDARLVATGSTKELMTAICQQRVDAGFLDQDTAVTGLLNGAACTDQPLRVIAVPNGRVRLGIGSTLEAAPAADRIRNAIDDLAAEQGVSDLYAKWGYLSGRSVEAVETILNARRRERWTIGVAAVFAVLFVIACWQAVRAVRGRNRARQAERALSESERRYRSLIETAQEGIWTLDHKGKVTYVNQKLATMLGYSREELLGQSADMFIDPALLEESRHKRESRERGIKESSDYIFRRKDGTVLHAIVAASPVTDAHGNYTGVLGMVADITARKQAEEALRQSEEKYRSFFEEDLAGCFISNRDGKLLDCNSSYLRIFRFASRQHALETKIESLYPIAEKRKELWELLERRGRLEGHEGELLRMDGTRISIIANVIGLRDERDELEQIRGYIIDNTERKKAEEQVRTSQKLDAIGRLAGGVAHDFNNLLTVIIGYSSRLLSQLRRSDPAYDEATEIKAAAQRASKLTNQLLAFGRKQVLQPRALNLNEVISNMREMLRRLVGEGIDLVVVPHSGLDMVKADPTQIEQVIMNLVINSRDAMRRGGKITIETSNAFWSEQDVGRPASLKPGAYVVLAVTDNGCGMDAETQSRIFEPFFTTKEGGGTGLGLPTVYGIVNQSGGSVSVYSEVGHGTTFKIHLPSVEETAGTLPEEEGRIEEEPESGSETILVVDDDDTIRVMVCRVLVEKGYTVLSASDPREAIQIHRKHPRQIDLLLTDVVMPHMSGRDLAAELARQRPHIKVLYMSGYTKDAMIHQGLLSQGTSLLWKPFEPLLLLREVRRTLQSSDGRISILVVDDHPAIRKLIRSTLEEAGYRVLEASSADEALARLSETTIHLVITDLNLPGQSGAELAEAVKSRHSGVALIMVSGSFGSKQESLAKHIGVSAVLPKTVEPETLLETVRNVLGVKSDSTSAS
jgi:PAS domain S-box-containing protein